MAQYLDFGEFKLRKEEEYGLAFDVTGVPLILSEWLLGVHEGFSDVVLQGAGATAPILYSETVRQGSAHGFSLCTLRIELRWS
jgi:hypothetical protein